MAKFHIGLTMAGAISAGAYTAGVFDFLTEALDEWEKEKLQAAKRKEENSPPTVPDHDVVIPVITGASAGGMTGALGLIALADRPMDAPPNILNIPDVGQVTTRLPRLYDAWVTTPNLISVVGGSSFLGNDDLNDGNGVRSLLDGSILDKIALENIANIKTISPRPYFPEKLHFFVTLSNLRGAPYDIGFIGGSQGQPGYAMTNHRDWAHFSVQGLNSNSLKIPSPWADQDPSKVTDFTTIANLPVEGKLEELPSPWREFLTAALGTGAFPIGLPARVIEPVLVKDVVFKRWPNIALEKCGNGGYRLPTSFPSPFSDPAFPPDKLLASSPIQIENYPFSTRPVNYVAVDGGLLNNEPFELARWTLMSNPPHGNPRIENANQKVDRAVIMVDPFPEAIKYDCNEKLNDLLLSVISKIFPTLLNQVRFKPEELSAAFSEDVYSRYLISPRRRRSPQENLETYPLACGVLGGFGGFLDERLRAHDYQLGRLNCYLFLKNHLVLPENYNIVADGYRNLSADQKKAFEVSDGTNTYLQIIPLCGSAATPPQPPSWPRVSKKDVSEMADQADIRADLLYQNLKKKSVQGILFNSVVTIAWNLYMKKKVRSLVYWMTIKDLTLRDQLEEIGKNASENDRKVLSSLNDISYDYRTVKSIADQFCMTENDVISSLNRQKELIFEGEKINGAFTYTLKERAPSKVSQWPGISWIARQWSGDPKIA
ncbi:Patatin-like phospholipase [Azospirillaceae bacterium]